MYVTFVGYLWKIQGIFLYSIFPEYYLGIFPGISLGIFSEYSGEHVMGKEHIFAR